MSFVYHDVGAPEPSIEIQLPKNLLKIDGIDDAMEEAIMDAALEARNFWETLAGQRLKSSRSRYQDAIKLEQNPDGVELLLDDPFAVAVENGWTPQDQRPGFMRSSNLKDGPVKKIPRAVAAQFMHNKPACTKYMIIPLNTQRDYPMSKPGAFRMFTDKQQGLWPASPKARRGVFLAKEVKEELANEILPKHIEKAIDKLLGDQ